MKIFYLTALAAFAAMACSLVSATEYEPDDDYLDLHFKPNQWAPASTAAIPRIVICEGVFRYWPSTEPRPVCEEATKSPNSSVYKPARFIQLEDWLEIHGYKPSNFIDITDDYTLRVSILKTDDRVFEGEEYEDFYGHKPGYIFSGVGGVETGAIVPKQEKSQ
ncbi:hypothetical protein ACK249_003620 [Pseudomonas aeruginosa]|uniref:hypothetical protein n=1 Tax=Pseudomonas aeruginosa TaxID=287 RepID=UPI0025C918C5|nr:hypothetical protein [Pseudomonas aeruginosa]